MRQFHGPSYERVRGDLVKVDPKTLHTPED